MNMQLIFEKRIYGRLSVAVDNSFMAFRFDIPTSCRRNRVLRESKIMIYLILMAVIQYIAIIFYGLQWMQMKLNFRQSSYSRCYENLNNKEITKYRWQQAYSHKLNHFEQGGSRESSTFWSKINSRTFSNIKNNQPYKAHIISIIIYDVNLLFGKEMLLWLDTNAGSSCYCSHLCV